MCLGLFTQRRTQKSIVKHKQLYILNYSECKATVATDSSCNLAIQFLYNIIHVILCMYVYIQFIYIYMCIYIYISGVKISALTQAILISVKHFKNI